MSRHLVDHRGPFKHSTSIKFDLLVGAVVGGFDTMSPHGPPPVGGDQSRVPLIIGFFTAMTVLSFLCTITRLYTRIHLVRDPGWDDAIIAISELFSIINYGMTWKSTTYGIGRHVYYLKPHRVLQAVKWNFISNPFGIIGVSLPRVAIAMFIARVVGPNHRREMLVIYFLTISTVIASIISAILLFAQCNPPSTAWDPKPTSVCWNPKHLEDYSVFVGAYSAFNDFVLALYPVTIISKLQMSVKRKIDISIIMLGLIACICSIIRTTKFSKLADYSDITWSGVAVIITTAAEINALIICACIPTLLPLVQQIMGRKDYHSKSGKPTDQYNSHNKPSASWRPLPADPDMELMKVDQGGVETTVFGSDGHGRKLPERGIQRTTDMQTQWEAV